MEVFDSSPSAPSVADIGCQCAAVERECADILAIAHLDSLVCGSAVGYLYLRTIIADSHIAIGVNAPSVVAELQ